MTGNELLEIAIRLSGRPARKNKEGSGALRWIANKLDVHPTTITRWVRGPTHPSGYEIPKWAEQEILEMDAEYWTKNRELVS